MGKKIYLSALISLIVLSLFAGATLSWFTDDGELAGFSFTTADGGTVTFSVYEEVYGDYMEGIAIDVFDMDEGEEVGAVVTDEEGEAEKGLFSGEYRYEVDVGTDYTFLNERYSGSGYDDLEFRINNRDVGIEVYLEKRDR